MPDIISKFCNSSISWLKQPCKLSLHADVCSVNLGNWPVSVSPVDVPGDDGLQVVPSFPTLEKFRLNTLLHLFVNILLCLIEYIWQKGNKQTFLEIRLFRGMIQLV